MEPPRVLKDSVSVGLAMVYAIVLFIFQAIILLAKGLIKMAPVLLLVTVFVMQGMKFQFLEWNVLTNTYGRGRLLLLIIGTLVLTALWLVIDGIQTLYMSIRALCENVGGLAIYLNHLRRTGDLGSLRESVIVDRKSTIVSFIILCAVILVAYLCLELVL